MEAARAETSAVSFSATPVLFVAVSPKYGGAEKHTLDLLESFAGSGAKVLLVCTGPDVFSERLPERARGYVTVQQQTGLHSFLAWYALFRRIRPRAVVLIKSWMWCFPWYTLAAAKLAGVERRYSILHLPPAPPAGAPDWRYRWSHRRLAVGSRADICVSEALRQRLITDCGFPPQTTLTIPNGVSLQRFAPDTVERRQIRERLGVGSEDLLVVCTASLIPQKRVDVLLEALARVDPGVPMRCLILGEGELREALEGKARASGLAARVSFLGFQSNVRGYLRAADVFALTSDKEGLPLSILEAMACATPCVVTRVGGNAEAVRDGIDGYVLPPGDAAGIAAALTTLAREPERRAVMAAAARKRVEEHFDLEQSMARIRERITA